MDRRQFLKAIATGTVAAFFDPTTTIVKRALSASYFGLHPFIEAHPEAVFIMKTNVTSKMDSDAKKQAGIDFAFGILTLRDTPGFPLNQQIAIKPNLVGASGRSNEEDGMGIVTDPYFIEGIIERMINFGLSADAIYMREGNWLGDGWCNTEYLTSPYVGVAERTSTHLLDFPTGRNIYDLFLNTMQEGSEIIWKDCPDGVVFRRIGYVAPFNQQDTWLLDIAKFKCHTMGMTSSVKNLQGMCVNPYIHFCEGVDGVKNHPGNVLNDFQPDFDVHTEELYAQHFAGGMPRWDKPGSDVNSGYGMELWAQRMCDSISVTNVGLSIIEGIYGRNGHFFEGPGPGNTAQDFMTNVIIFGKNPFYIDIIGHWMGGHEPGNFGLFHIAKERNLSETINPATIPVYIWEDGAPHLTSLDKLERFDLKTLYLQRNYGGQDEPLYHLVNEPFDYGSPIVIKSIAINLFCGWNMVSCPGDPVISDIATITAGKKVFPFAYIFNPVTDKFDRVYALEFGKSYWFAAGEDTNITLEYYPRYSLSYPLKKGWNMLGSLSCDVPTSSLMTTPPGQIFSFVYCWDTVNKTFSQSYNIKPGDGYYITANSDCTLMMNGSSSSLLSPAIPVESYHKPKSNTLRTEKPNIKLIGQNFPNPFNGSTNIEYTLLNDGYVTLDIYDSRGTRIDVLVNSWQMKGTHLVSWDAGQRASGIYFYAFRTDGFEKIGKMVLIR